MLVVACHFIQQDVTQLHTARGDKAFMKAFSRAGAGWAVLKPAATVPLFGAQQYQGAIITGSGCLFWVAKPG